MSIKVMTAVWDCSLAPMERLVLLAYADHADHAGNNVYPSLGTIARKTGLERRSVMRIRKRLEKIKVMVATSHKDRQPTCFRIDTGSLPRDTTPLEEDRDTESLGTLNTPARDTGSPKPSIEPSIDVGTELRKKARAKRAHPSVLTEHADSRVSEYLRLLRPNGQGITGTNADIVMQRVDLQHLPIWVDVLARWAVAQWNPTNFAGLFDAYDRGVNAQRVVAERGVKGARPSVDVEYLAELARRMESAQ